jgi:hypothetical protein
MDALQDRDGISTDGAGLSTPCEHAQQRPGCLSSWQLHYAASSKHVHRASEVLVFNINALTLFRPALAIAYVTQSTWQQKMSGHSDPSCVFRPAHRMSADSQHRV